MSTQGTKFKWTDTAKDNLIRIHDSVPPNVLHRWEIIFDSFQKLHEDYKGTQKSLGNKYYNLNRSQNVDKDKLYFEWSKEAKVHLVRLVNTYQVAGYPDWTQIWHEFRALHSDFDGSKKCLNVAYSRILQNDGVEKEPPLNPTQWSKANNRYLLQAIEKVESVRYAQEKDGRKKVPSNELHEVLKYFKKYFKEEEGSEFMGADTVVINEFYNTRQGTQFKWTDTAKNNLIRLHDSVPLNVLHRWEIIFDSFQKLHEDYKGTQKSLGNKYYNLNRSQNIDKDKLYFEWSKEAKVHLVRLVNTYQVDGYPNWAQIWHEFRALHSDFDGSKNCLSVAYRRILQNDGVKLKNDGVEKEPPLNPTQWSKANNRYLLQAIDKVESVRYAQERDGRKKVPSNELHEVLKYFKKYFKEEEGSVFMGADTVVITEFYNIKWKGEGGSYRCEENYDTVSNFNMSMLMSHCSKNHSLVFSNLFRYCCHHCGTLFFKSYSTQRKLLVSPLSETPRVTLLYETLEHEYKIEDKFVTCIECVRNSKWVLDYDVSLKNLGMKIPKPLQDLNEYERNQVAICGGFYNVYRFMNKERRIFQHNQGEANIGKKRDIDYQGVFTAYYGIKRPQQLEGSDQKIVAALRWLRKNNHLFRDFLSNYETLFRYFMSKSEFRPEEKIIQVSKGTLEEFVGKETGGLLIPSENVQTGNAIQPSQHTFGVQHPLRKPLETVRSLINVTYSDEHLEAKRWPHLFPEGNGSWKQHTSLKPQTYVKKQLLNIDSRFRMTSEFMFFWLDRLIKSRLLYYSNQSRSVDTNALLNTLKSKDVKNHYSKYGNTVPSTIPGSRSYWGARKFDLLAMVRDLGTPTLFITLTQNDNWPELQKACGLISDQELNYINDVIMQPATNGQSIVSYPVEAVAAFYRRLSMFMASCIHNKKGPFGEVLDYWYRIEYQNRGALHCHMVIWVCEDTLPSDVVSAQMPRYSGKDEKAKQFAFNAREYVKQFQLHNCLPERCYQRKNGKIIRKCKYGFPFELQDIESESETKMGYKYVRKLDEDKRVVPYNLYALMSWNGHLNVQKVTTNGIETYLCKYVSKPEKSVDIRDITSETEKYLKARVVGSLECCAILLQLRQVSSTRMVIFLPCDFIPLRRMLKRQNQLPADDESEDIYYKTALEKYLRRPKELDNLTYPDLFKFYDITYASNRKPTKPVDSNESDSEPEISPKADETQCTYTERVKKIKKTRKEYVSYGYKYKERGKAAVPRWRYIVPFGKETEKFYEQYLLLNVPISQDELDEEGYPFSAENQSKTFVEECCLRDLIDAEENAKRALIGAIQQGFSVDRVVEIAALFVNKNFISKEYADSIVLPWVDSMPVFDTQEGVDEEHGEELQRLLDGRINVEPFETYYNSMNESQKQTLDWIQDKIKQEDQILAIISGGAGVGKSFVTKAIYSLFRERKMLCVLLATTGAAAHLISGTTLHYYLKMDIEGNCYLQKGTLSAKIIEDTDAIIVDEFSMLSSDLLEHLHTLTSKYSNTRNSLFGGKHVFLIGDPCQLPSIQTPVFCNPLMHKFSILLLKETVRQTDKLFVGILNRVRLNELTSTDILTLRERYVDASTVEYEGDILIVTATRAKMDFYNSQYISAFPGNAVRITAVDYEEDGTPVSETVYQSIRKYVRSRWDDELVLKEGCVVRLLRNIDISNAWVNSKRARVFRVSDDGKFVILQDLENQDVMLPLTKMRQNIKIGQTSYYRLQFPLKLGYATTVHAVQGTTVTGKYYVDLDRSFWETGQAYVALSRPKLMSQLFLLNTHFEKVILKPYYKTLLNWMIKCDEIALVKTPRTWNDFPLLILAEDSDVHIFPDPNEKKQKEPKKATPFKKPRQKKVKEMNVHVEKQSIFNSPPPANNVASIRLDPIDNLAEECIDAFRGNLTPTEIVRLGCTFFEALLKRINDETGINFIICPNDNIHHDKKIQESRETLWKTKHQSTLTCFEKYIGKYRLQMDTYLDIIQAVDISLYDGQLLHTFINVPDEYINVKPVAVPGDGSCFYHSVSVCLIGCTLFTNSLKLLAAYVVNRDTEYFDNLYTRLGTTRSDVITRTLSMYKWADIDNFYAISRAIDRPINVINRFCPSITNPVDITINASNQNATSIDVAYVSIAGNGPPNHYVALLQLPGCRIDIRLPNRQRNRTVEVINLEDDDPMFGTDKEQSVTSNVKTQNSGISLSFENSINASGPLYESPSEDEDDPMTGSTGLANKMKNKCTIDDNEACDSDESL